MSNALAENKLILLYTLKGVKLKLSKEQFSDLILETIYINYFKLQEYISELMESQLIEITDTEARDYISITEKGITVLELFQHIITDRKKQAIDEYLKNNIQNLIKETTVSSFIQEGHHGSYVVTLKAFENQDEIISIDLNLPTKKSAENAAENWKKNSQKIYANIFKNLVDQE
ncbi:MAG: DUF4364 family protein [Clostridium sp.]|nr:DUF4364 family protein [Clostridium sp.]